MTKRAVSVWPGLALAAYGGVRGPRVAAVVSVADVVEAVHPAELDHEHDVEGVDGRVSPALVVEAAGLVQVVEEAQVSLVAKYCKRGHLEVVPELKALHVAQLGSAPSIVVLCLLLLRERGGQWRHVLIGTRVHATALLQPALDRRPQRRHVAYRLAARNREAVELVASHERLKGVLARERTRKLSVRVQAQVVVVAERELVVEEEAAVEAAHVMVGDAHRLGDVLDEWVEGEMMQARGVNPLGRGPVLGRSEAEVDR